ncbi:hypothetical protein DI005_20125 [Prauserella sp. PE36]|uniref:hypothetical protein n=1 Tax=Prauserella sp. PE36 TaxID=1504709 RepID=UPI000DE232AA|nr:hypothetical protein [Prauserella sp. PE36]RBM18102.1 hypothetical protein DI005_20125 [Prauserella sp. PE36]
MSDEHEPTLDAFTPARLDPASGVDADEVKRSHDLVRSLTVIPPWSTALTRWKPVENRTTNLAGTWRGRVLILSSLRKWDPRGDDVVRRLTGHRLTREQCHPGHYVGAADLIDAHRGDGTCCAPWGEPGVWHLVMANPVEFTTPIPGTGHLGLRRVTDTHLTHAALTRAHR